MPHIDSQAVAGIRSAFAARRHERIRTSLAASSLSLGGAMEVAAWISEHGSEDPDGTRVLSDIPHPAIATARTMWRETKPRSVELACRGMAEISHVSDLGTEDKRWWDFLARFDDALVRARFPKGYPKALAHTFHEMADNIRLHASDDSSVRPPAIAGWHVVDETAFFTVTDAGRGMMESLRTSPKWKHLTSDREALVNVVCNHATRIVRNTWGDGYSNVVRNFVSRNGCLALRSGTAELIASGTALEDQITTRPCNRFKGTRIAAWCCPSKTVLPSEPVL